MAIMSFKSDLHAIIDQTNGMKVLEAVKHCCNQKC